MRCSFRCEICNRDAEYKGAYQLEIDHGIKMGDAVSVNIVVQNKPDSGYNQVLVQCEWFQQNPEKT